VPAEQPPFPRALAPGQVPVRAQEPGPGGLPVPVLPGLLERAQQLRRPTSSFPLPALHPG